MTPANAPKPIAGEDLILQTSQAIQRRNTTAQNIDQAEKNLVQLRQRHQAETEQAAAMQRALAAGEAYQPK